MESKQDRATSATRRQIFGAALAAPFVLTGKAGAMTLGSGDHEYEVHHDWAKLPASVQLGYTHGVIEDRLGRIFIHNRSKDAVAIFDADGRFIKSWGARFEKGAHGLQLVKEGSDEFLFLSDPEGHEVVKTALDGEELLRIGVPKESGVYDDPTRFKPTNTAVAPNGDIYVADGYGLSYIHRYNKKGEYISTWGGKGAEAGKMNCPHGIWIDARDGNPTVLVADRANIRLQMFSLEGKHMGFVTENLRHPCHFDVRGEELLIPDLHGRVTIFNGKNELVVHLGDYPDIWKQKGYPNLPQEMRLPGKFISPHAACWDHSGNIYVVEWVSDGRITKLRKV
ncbi:MAG: hypothetical protein KJZ70_14665 [Bryobacterales bacterium]|nr:hypothetical protein [Bryobacterales bacterium]